MSDIQNTDWKLVDFDPAAQVSTWSRWQDGRYQVKTMSRTDMLRKVAAEQRAAAGNKWAGDYHHVAQIPGHMVFNNDNLVEAIRLGDEAYFKRWLNDRDHSAFRTKEGVL